MDGEAHIGIYSITATSEMTGIPVSTLRYWEKSYGLVKPVRTDGGHRLYSQEDVERLHWLKARIDEGLQPGVAHRLLERELRKLGGIAQEAQHRGAIMILVAERDPITAQLEEYFLRKEGYEVRVVLDGRKAVQEARTMQPDLIIVDVILPGLNGLKVCEQLKADPETAHIALLVFSVLDVRDRALGAGADAFLLKPLEQPKLIEIVKSMLAVKADVRA